MARGQPTRRTPFGAYLKELRASLGETQTAFATRLSVSRSVIANIETSTPPSRAFIDTLIAAFPELANDVLTASGSSVSPRPKPPSPQLEHFIRECMRTGALAEARTSLEHAWRDKPQLTRDARLWVHETLAQVHATEGNPVRGVLSLVICASIADRCELDLDHTIAIYDKMVLLASQAHPELANSTFDLALRMHSTIPTLWLRKAVVHWHAYEFSSAYAALAQAEMYRSRRRWVNVELVRGQMLAEWGRSHDALVELDRALMDSTIAPHEVAYAEAAQAFAQYEGVDTLAAVENSFVRIGELLGDDGLLYYFRARCYADAYMSLPDASDDYYEAAVLLFDRAQQARSRPLSQTRLDVVRKRLVLMEKLRARRAERN